MKPGIEIYVRCSGERVLLNLHVPSAAKASFLKALAEGTLESGGRPIAVELYLQSDWISDIDVRARLQAEGGPIHARIPITAINVNYSD